LDEGDGRDDSAALIGHKTQTTITRPSGLDKAIRP
jgi:hypothetical protein